MYLSHKNFLFGKILMTSFHVICGLDLPQSKILGTPMNWRSPKKNFWRRFFFFLENTCACVLGPWPWPRAFLSLASRSSVLGKAVLGLGLGVFLCPWPWPRALCPRLHLCYLMARNNDHQRRTTKKPCKVFPEELGHMLFQHRQSTQRDLCHTPKISRRFASEWKFGPWCCDKDKNPTRHPPVLIPLFLGISFQGICQILSLAS